MNMESRVAKLEQAHGTPGVCSKCAKFGDPFARLKDGLTEAEVLTEFEAEALQEPHVVKAKAQAYPCGTCGRALVVVIQFVNNRGAENEH